MHDAVRRLQTEHPEGLSVPAAARELGISASWAYECLTDPAPKYKPPKWTRENVIEAFQEWDILTGHPPKIAEWQPRPEGYPWVPSVKSVYTVFGSWNAAMEAAGFRPRPSGFPEEVLAHPIKNGADVWDGMTPEEQEEARELRRRHYREGRLTGLEKGWEMERRRYRRSAARREARS